MTTRLAFAHDYELFIQIRSWPPGVETIAHRCSGVHSVWACSVKLTAKGAVADLGLIQPQNSENHAESRHPGCCVLVELELPSENSA